MDSSGASKVGNNMVAMNPMLLQHTLRGLCSNDSQWVYAVFWRILPRNYPPPQWDTEGGIMDRSKGNRRNWILVWEDGFCNFSACSGAVNDRGLQCCESSFLSVRHEHQVVHSCSTKDVHQVEAMNPELFFKMSHEVYNYGEGLMGKVAVDNSHKWVHQEPLDQNEMVFLSPWHHSNNDPHPRTWEGQFKSGIKTIAVIAVQEGVLQLGSTNKIMEDLSFVLYMQRKFNCLRSVIPGVFVPHPASSGSGISEIMAKNQVPEVPEVVTSPWQYPPVAGKKRRPPESSESLKSRRWCNSYKLNGIDTVQEESPSKALHTQLHSSPHNFMIPSMSSLQALLSKLPSVTSALENNNSSYELSNGSYSEVSTISGGGGGVNDFNSMIQLPALSSDGSHELQRMVELEESNITSPNIINTCNLGDDVGNDHEDVELVNYKEGAKENHRYNNNSMFDSFGNLTEFGIQEALENGEYYSSFLNEICS